MAAFLKKKKRKINKFSYPHPFEVGQLVRFRKTSMYELYTRQTDGIIMSIDEEKVAILIGNDIKTVNIATCALELEIIN